MGFNTNYWRFVFKYHNGANDIILTEPDTDGKQFVTIKGNKKILHFKLVMKSNVETMKNIPVILKIFCDEF